MMCADVRQGSVIALARRKSPSKTFLEPDLDLDQKMESPVPLAETSKFQTFWVILQTNNKQNHIISLL